MDGIGKSRKSNFELMRIIAMLMIVLWHVIIYGNILGIYYNSFMSSLFSFLKFFLVIHVNLFMLLTGYFQISTKFKFSKIIKIISQLIFYNILILIIFLICGLINFDKVEVFKYLFLWQDNDQWWFIIDYILLYCLSPFLNKALNKFNKKDFQKLILVLFIIFSVIPWLTGNRFFSNNGYTLYNFIFLYIIGSYLRLYPIQKSYVFKSLSKKSYRIILLFIYFSFGLANYFIFRISNFLINYNDLFTEIFINFSNYMIFNYSNPFIIIQTISFFLFFETLNFKNKIINKISTLVFGVYIIHENYYLKQYLYKWLNLGTKLFYSWKYAIYILLMAAFIFITCVIIELIRQLIVKVIFKFKFIKNSYNKFNSWLNNLFEIKI